MFGLRHFLRGSVQTHRTCINGYHYRSELNECAPQMTWVTLLASLYARVRCESVSGFVQMYCVLVHTISFLLKTRVRDPLEKQYIYYVRVLFDCYAVGYIYRTMAIYLMDDSSV